MSRSSESPNASAEVGAGRAARDPPTPPRTPSPVQFPTSSASSRPTTPLGKEGGRTAIPSFTVTSSQHTPGTSASTTRALNPQAKAFEFPSASGLGGCVPEPLFAMPAPRASPPSALPGLDESRPPWGGIVSGRTSASPSLQQQREDVTVAQLQTFLRRRYTDKCTAEKLHMVAVFNLDPHTSRDALQQMFFPMGGSAAEVLRPTDFPSELGTTPLVGRRFVGVVFFPQKTFAMVGVEKRDHFVPSGQHQPLRVVYCGPDAEACSLSGSALPPSLAADGQASVLPWMLSVAELEKVHAEMRNRFANVAHAEDYTMVALHGLDASTATSVLRKHVMGPAGAARCEPWPPQQGCVETPWRCRSISAVVWYHKEGQAILSAARLDGKILDGQRYPVRAVVLSRQPVSGLAARARPGSTRANAMGFGGAKAPSMTTDSSGNRDASFASPDVSLAETDDAGATDESFDITQNSERVHGHFLARWKDPSVHLVAVHNLDPMTDKKRLYKIFYPIGAFDAELFPSQVIFAGKPRRSGVALFHSRDMAEEAAKKIHDFVPHEQTRPLIAYLLTRSDNGGGADSTSSGKAAADGLATPVTPTRAVAPVAASSTAAAAASTPRSGVLAMAANASLPQLQESVKAQLAAPSVNIALLAETMAQLATHPDCDDAAAAEFANMLSRALVEMQHHSVKLATPLSSALMALHDLLGIRTPPDSDGVASSVNTSTEQEHNPNADEKAVDFVRQIARSMMVLVVNMDAPREPRSVAAMLCGYLFQFHYLPGSPYAFAMRLLRSNQAALQDAKAYLAREPGIPTSADAERTNRPWVTLVESLEEMTSLWRRHNKARYAADADAKQYEEFINDFYDGNPPRSICAGSGGRTGCNGNSPSCDNSGESPTTGLSSAAATTTTGSSGKRQALLTPSARPTPRRVVTRMSPGHTGSATRLGAKGLSGVGEFGGGGAGTGVMAPHVVLSPASDNTQGVSADISLESNHPSSGVPHSLRPLGLLSGIQRSFAAQQAANGIGASARPLPSLSGGALGGVGVGAGYPAIPGAGATAMNPSVNSAASGTPFQEHRSDCCECTVYVTKLPSPFTAGQVRRMLSYFGEVNKVRLCRDEKENVLPGAGSYSKLCYGFVEFAEPHQAKSMVEYFRNAVHAPSSFEFLRVPAGTTDDGTYFSEGDINLLRSTRTSQARNPIHDQQPLDAVLRPATAGDGPALAGAGVLVRVQRCLFGILKPNVSIEAYQEAVQNEPIPTIPQPPVLSQPHQQPQMKPATATAAAAAVVPVFSTGLGARGMEAWGHRDPVQDSTSPTVTATSPTWDPIAPAKMPTLAALATPPHVENDSDSDDDYDAIMGIAVRHMQGTLPDAAAAPHNEAGATLSTGSEAISDNEDEARHLCDALTKTLQ